MTLEAHTMKSTVTVAMVQDNFTVGDIKKNADRIIELSLQAREQGARLAVFPELSLVGYPPEDLLHRGEFIRQTEQALQTIQSAVSGIDIVLGLPESQQGGLYNSALWLRDGEVVARYHKHLLPNYSVFDEKRYFTAGTEQVSVELDGIRFGLAICEDIWPQSDGHLATFDGVDCLLVINASPYHIGKYQDRVETIRTQSQQSDMSLLYINMTGGQDELVFDGESLACDQQGDIQYRAPAFADDLALVDVTTDSISSRQASAEIVTQIEAIYKALVLGVHDFVGKNGFQGVVIGLSGGVDSALTLAIAVDALGKDNVHAVMMPSMYTADMSQTDAQLEADALGVRYDVVPIETSYHAFTDILQHVFSGTQPDTTEENIQARCRGLILMAISNKSGRMVLTTGNKSEMAVGYATLYGDMCGGFAPLKDISKTLVYELCRYRNAVAPVIPERVLTRAPSAELRPDQTDQDSLPDYDVLDRILELSVEQDRSIDDIVATGIDRDEVVQVVSMVRNTEYKRKQAAPGVRITKRAFGRDRRYPITSHYREH